MPKPIKTAAVDLDLDLDLDLDISLGGESEEPDPLEGVEYSGNIERDSAEEFSALKKAFIARAQEENKRREKATDSGYWVAFCFQSREQKEQFLKLAKLLKLGDKYIDGQKAAKILGIPIDRDASGFGRVKIDPKLANLAME